VAQIELTDGELSVHVRGFDKVLALRSRLTIPLRHVTGAGPASEETKAIWHGLRLAGAGIPGVVRAGTFLANGRLVFWDVHEGDAALDISLEHEEYAHLIVEVDDVDGAARRINQALARPTP
jgi:hypothetical protein